MSVFLPSVCFLCLWCTYLYCVLLKWGVFWFPLVAMVMCGWLPGHCRAWYPSFNGPFTVTSLTAGRAFSAWIPSMQIVCSPLCKPVSALWWDSMGGFCIQGMCSRGKWGSISETMSGGRCSPPHFGPCTSSWESPIHVNPVVLRHIGDHSSLFPEGFST